MTPSQPPENSDVLREQRLLAAALSLETESQRSAFLASLRDDALRRRLEELLAASAEAESFFADRSHPAFMAAIHQTAPVARSCPDPALPASRMIGRYKLLEKIGEGGFGEVWMAEQREPVKRRVALKIIKPGMDSRQVVARFEAERQALAMMDHANIARIFDADVTEAGRPYFVMELVRGVRITDYCDEHQLATPERLVLFIKVCQAIQHAHQKGVIHRDIKPSNILVTLHDGVPVPKVIDFGIAKATQQELTDLTVFTQFQQFIGTPAYISPEQAETSGLDIDTRADIYSLGVLLYELLVGQTPFSVKEMMQGGLDALVRIIREREPQRPSTKLNTLQAEERTTAGKRRQTDVGKLVHLLQGDLDWVVMKCLEKDRTRRYDTANGLALDVQRYLGNEPVSARPPGMAYRFRKFYRRNKLVCAAAAVVALTLVAGTGVSLWQAMRATDARNESERRFREAAAERDAKTRAQAALESRNAELRRAVYHAQLLNVMPAMEQHDEDGARNLLDGCEPDLRGWEWACLNSRLRLVGRIPFVNERGRSGRGYLTRDGTRLYSIGVVSSGSFFQSWDLKSGHRLREDALPGVLTSMAMSPDENRAVLSAADGSVLLYEPGSGRTLWSVPVLAGKIRGLAFHPAGTRLAASVPDGTIALLDAATGRRLMTGQSAANLYSLAFSPDGGTLLAGSSTGGAWLLDADSLEKKAECDAAGSGHLSVAFSPDGARFVTGGTDGSVQIWDTARRQVLINCSERHVKTVELPGQPVRNVSNVSAVAFSPDGSRIASGGEDTVIRVWAASSGELLAAFPSGIDVLGWMPGLQFSADGRRLLAVGGALGDAGRLWNLTHDHAPTVTAGHTSQVWAAAFTPDSQRVVSAGWDGRIRLWQAVDGLAAGDCQGHTNILWSVAVTPDGRRAVSGSQDGTVRIWDLATGAADGEAITAQEPAGENANNWTLFVAVSPDGRRVACGGMNGRVQAWDIGTRARLWDVTAMSGQAWSVAWSPDGEKIAVGNNTGLLTMLDAQQGRQLWHENSPLVTIIQSIAFAPDGQTLVTGGWHGELILRDAADGRLKAQAGASVRAIRSVAFSPDGKRIASAGDDGTVRFWDPLALTRVYALPVESKAINAVAFSPDGKRLVTGNAGGQVRIWQTEPLLPAVPQK